MSVYGLEGQVAIVTGASRGIGRAIAIRLAKEGAAVVINYNGSKEKAEEVKAVIEAEGGKAEVYHCDVSDFEDVDTMIHEIIEKYGRLDILVNNAGINRDRMMVKMSEGEFDEVIATNLKGNFNTMRVAARQMMSQRSGRIVNIASIVGINGNIGQINYTAAKAGVIAMTKTAAKEMARYGITVNAIAPGFIETDMTNGVPEKIRQGVAQEIPLRYIGKPEQVAAAAAFLCSEDANYITGQLLNVDGGLAM